ncbi:MAG: GtrA family protein [Bacillota bacterium]
MQKLKTLYSEKQHELWEMIRYIVAGALTTAVSLIVSYGSYMIMAADHTINGASTAQVAIGNVISWIVAVIFAFWINRWMVFRVKYADQKTRMKAFFQFVSARVISLLLFEVGLAALLNIWGVQNIFGRIIVLVLVMAFNYIASKFWIFKPKQ